MPKRIRDLTRAQQDFIEGYINGICSFVARGPRGESARTTERQFEECKSMMQEDEEKLVEMGEDWLKGIVKVFAPPPAVYDYYEWRQIKPAEPEEIVPMRGMRMMGARQESEEIRRRRREDLSGGRVHRAFQSLSNAMEYWDNLSAFDAQMRLMDINESTDFTQLLWNDLPRRVKDKLEDFYDKHVIKEGR